MPRTTTTGLSRPVKKLVTAAVLAVLAYIAYLTAHVVQGSAHQIPYMVCALLITAAVFTLAGMFKQAEIR
jgi:hypothetical protein